MHSVRGQVLSGTQIASEIKTKLKNNVLSIKEKVRNFQPKLAIVQVGGRQDSNVYIRMKLQAAEEIGIVAEHIRLPQTATEQEVLHHLKDLNDNPNVHGIIVQMPLDSVNKIDSHLITDSVHPSKDVDGLHTLNEGKVAIGNLKGLLPCTPAGVLELIKRSNITIEGATAVVLGRSKIVGTPVAELLKWHHATVTVCHSKTKNLKYECQKADILVVAIGKPELVKKDWIKPGAVVIDCGINVIPDSSKKSGQRLVGDVAYEESKHVASYITPVPGGVGPMTVAMLLSNTLKSAENILEHVIKTTWKIRPLPLNLKQPVPSDIEIARSQIPKHIMELAEEIGLLCNEVAQFGSKKAKISLSVLDRLKHQPNGKYVVVTAITPTPFGEGKSTTILGLSQALYAKLNKKIVTTVRQPSQGPTFGIKGGAAGGGYSQVIPMEDMNLNLTGDIHAITAANNLLAAQLETRIFHEATQQSSALYDRLVPKIKGVRKFSKIQLRRLERLGIHKTDPDSLTETERTKFARLDIDPDHVTWWRCLDINDRYLREVTVGQSPTEKGLTRKTGFIITVASEIMAILALANDFKDFKDRLAKMVVAFDRNGQPVTADDLGVTGALLVLLKETVEPTLLQSLEGSPVLVHAGPFANIAHGSSSILADKIGLKLVGEDGLVLTEAGFASDIGMEKFFNIKCRASGIIPNAIVLVATIRALKMHGGGPKVTPGAPLAPEYIEENIELLKAGLGNVKQHIRNGVQFGLPVIVAINSHITDTEAEIKLLIEECKKAGAYDAILCKHWSLGGEGAKDLAEVVVNAVNKPNNFKFLYDLNIPLKAKVEKIAKAMYGAGNIVYSDVAEEKIKKCEASYSSLPVCMSKTHLSLTDDPTVKGAPSGFTLRVKDISVSAGAGFIVVAMGETPKIPGLPTRPAIYDIDLNTETGEIEGLF